MEIRKWTLVVSSDAAGFGEPGGRVVVASRPWLTLYLLIAAGFGALAVWEAASGLLVGWVALPWFGYLLFVTAWWFVRPPELRLTSLTLTFPLSHTQKTVELQGCRAFRTWRFFGWGYVTFDYDEVPRVLRMLSGLNRLFGAGPFSIHASLFGFSTRDLIALLDEYRALALTTGEAIDG